MNRKLFVGGLPWAVDSDELGKIFSQAGKVISAQVLTDRETGRSRGFGFVEMSSDTEAQQAIDQLNQSDVQGRKIIVNIARPREQR